MGYLRLDLFLSFFFSENPEAVHLLHLPPQTVLAAQTLRNRQGTDHDRGQAEGRGHDRGQGQGRSHDQRMGNGRTRKVAVEGVVNEAVLGLGKT